VFKPCINFEQNRTIGGRVIDDLSHFRSKIFNVVPNPRKVLIGMHGPNVTKLGEDTHHHLCSEFVSELRYLATFANAGRSKMSGVENDAKFRTFCPCKN